MAEKDIIARLKVEGIEDYISKISTASKSQDDLTKSIDGSQKALIDSVKANKEVSSNYADLSAKVEESQRRIREFSKGVLTGSQSINKLSASIVELKSDIKQSESGLKSLETQIKNTAPGQGQVELIKQFKELSNAIDIDKQSLAGLEGQLKNMKAEGKSTSQTIRELRRELEKMRLAGLENTEQYRDLEAEIGRMQNAVKSTRDELNTAASSTKNLDVAIRGLQTGASTFGLLQGATALFGVESEKLGETLVKLNAIMTISTSLQQLQAEALRNDSVFSKAAAVGQLIYTKAVGASTGAMKLFRVALIATGVGAAVVAIGLLVANWGKLKDMVMNSIPGMEKVAQKIQQLKTSAQAFFRWLKNDKSLADSRAEVEAENKELERRARIEKGILEIERQIARVRAEGGSKLTIQQLTIAKLRAEQSLLQEGTEEYYNKQSEVNGVLKDNNKELKGTTDELKKHKDEIEVQVGSLKDLNQQYSRQKELVDSLAPGTQPFIEANEELIILGNKVKEVQDQIGESLDNVAKIAVSITNPFEAMVSSAPIAQMTTKQLGDQLSAINVMLADTNPEDDMYAILLQMSIDVEEQLKKVNKQIEDTKAGLKGELTGEELAVVEMNEANAKRLRDIEQLTTEQKLEELRKRKEAELAIAEEIGAETALINEFYREQERELRTEDAQNTLQTIQAITDIAGDIFKAANDNQKRQLQERLDGGLISEEQYQEELAKIKEKEARQEKAQALVSAAINIALQITKALGNPIAIGLIAAAGAVQMGIIASQEIPKFYDGVIDLKRGKNPSGRDTIPAMLNEGESVMTTKETKMYRSELEAIRRGDFWKNYIRSDQLPFLNYYANVRGEVGGGGLSKKDLKDTNDLLSQLIIRAGEGNNLQNRSIKEIKSMLRQKRRFYV